MYLVLIEGEVKRSYRVDDVVDFIEDKVAFEVDSTALIQELRCMEYGETIVLRDDCKVIRI